SGRQLARMVNRKITVRRTSGVRPLCDRSETHEVSMKTELDKFYALIDDIEIAMMTTRRPDGHLESRAMANQKQAAGADLWFVTAEGTAKPRDITADPHVNLAY